MPHTTMSVFANTVDPDVTAQQEPSHLDLHCLPYYKSLNFHILILFELKVFVSLL